MKIGQVGLAVVAILIISILILKFTFEAVPVSQKLESIDSNSPSLAYCTHNSMSALGTNVRIIPEDAGVFNGAAAILYANSFFQVSNCGKSKVRISMKIRPYSTQTRLPQFYIIPPVSKNSTENLLIPPNNSIIVYFLDDYYRTDNGLIKDRMIFIDSIDIVEER